GIQHDPVFEFLDREASAGRGFADGAGRAAGGEAADPGHGWAPVRGARDGRKPGARRWRQVGPSAGSGRPATQCGVKRDLSHEKKRGGKLAGAMEGEAGEEALLLWVAAGGTGRRRCPIGWNGGPVAR